MHAEAARKNLAIAAGGTGGHVYPALAVARELEQRAYCIQWLGTEVGLEARVVPEAGIELHFLRVRGLRGKGLGAKLQGMVLAFLAVLQAVAILRRLQPVCVLGMGGYVSGPVGLACRILRKPLLIHEQNSVAGTTNRLLCRHARRVLCAYPGAFDSDIDAIVVGNPVRTELIELGAALAYDYDGSRPLRLLVLGGSLGARAINEVLPETIGLLGPSRSVLVRHQTGTAHSKTVRGAYRAAKTANVEVVSYIEDMAAAYAWADLVLCRAGALTIAELTVMGRPAVLVPLPHAIDDHQLHNANWLVQAGGAVLLTQAEMNPESLSKLLSGLAASPARLAALAHAAKQAARWDAAARVADSCEEVRFERR